MDITSRLFSSPLKWSLVNRCTHDQLAFKLRERKSRVEETKQGVLMTLLKDGDLS